MSHAKPAKPAKPCYENRQCTVMIVNVRSSSRQHRTSNVIMLNDVLSCSVPFFIVNVDALMSSTMLTTGAAPLAMSRRQMYMSHLNIWPFAICRHLFDHFEHHHIPVDRSGGAGVARHHGKIGWLIFHQP